MTYHDNNVVLSLSQDYRLVKASFIITDYDVTPGQDLDGKIHNGLQVTTTDGTLTFQVGRKGSTDVASWFNGRITPAQTTFNHTAGKLNFAFIGDLSLTFTGGTLGSRVSTFLFRQVALAQGHSALRNNWWFGGVNCQNIGDNSVIATGTDETDAPVTFVFHRGGNGVNEIDITPRNFLDTGNWMARLTDSTLLRDIMMPGSHDAGMSELHHCAPPVGSGPFTKTQGVSVGNQLAAGSRYFDIRVDYDYDTLVTYHRSGQWGCNGQDLSAVLDETRQFLQTHQGEFAILKFSHIRNDSGHDAQDTRRRIDEVLAAYQAVIFTGNNINLTQVTVGLLRGKMLLVFDYNDYIFPANGRFRYHDRDGSDTTLNLSVYDVYSNTDDYEKMKADQLSKWQQHAYQDAEYLFLLSWTLTAGGITSPSVESMAAIANGSLPNVLSEQIIGSQAVKPNIIYIDFVNSTTCQSIIQFNFI